MLTIVNIVDSASDESFFKSSDFQYFCAIAH